MKIAMVHPRLTSKGGAENVVIWLSSELSSRGYEVSVISLESNPDLWSEIDLNKVRFIDLKTEARYSIGFMGRKLAPHLEGADIVCAHNTPAHWWATNAVNRLKKDIPIIWYCHEPHRLTYFSITDEISVKNVQNDSIGSLPNQEAFAQRIRKRVRHQRVLKSRWRRKQDATAVKSISSILANSQFTQENVKRAFGKDSKVCYPGIPESDKKPTYFSNRKGIVFLSNFVPSKNVFGMLGAVDKIVNQAGRKDIQFHFLGEGNSPEIQNYLKHKGLESYTEFHGFVSELEKQELLGSVRLCAFIPFCEPFGLVTLEAFRSGTPAIVSDHGGPAEVINNSGAGITVNPFDVESIAKGILGTYDDVEKLERMSEAGQKILCDGFYIKHLTDRFEQNFKMLMDGF